MSGTDGIQEGIVSRLQIFWKQEHINSCFHCFYGCFSGVILA